MNHTRLTCLAAAIVTAGCASSNAAPNHQRDVPRGRTGGDVADVDPAIARGLSAAFRAAADRALHAVVHVTTERGASRPEMAQLPMPEEFRRFFGFNGQQPLPPQIGTGSGVIYDDEGRILTNHHVVANAERVHVRLLDGREFAAEVVGSDPSTDVAVIRIEATGDPLTPVVLADSDSLRVGDWVLALGSPLGLDFTVTAGIVSARERQLGGQASALQSFIQTDAAVNPGNSGGPLVDLEGRMVGITTAIAGAERFIGYGFAVPSNLARRMASDLVELGFVRRPRIGIRVSDVTAVDAEAYGLDRIAGAEVNAVEPESPGASAGLRAGDVVVGLDGRPIETATQLTTELAERRPGERVRLTIVRDRARRDVTVTLGEFERPREARARPSPDASPASRLGFEVAPLTPDLARRLGIRETGGVVVTSVMPGSGAAAVGLRPGQVVISINGRAVERAADVARVAGQLSAGSVASVRVRDPELGETVLNYRVAQ